MVNNMPKYMINKEVWDNQALARSQAFGRSRDFQLEQSNIEKSSADAINAAKGVSSGTSGLLSTIAALSANRNNSLREMSIDESRVRAQNMGALYNANQSVIDEKDKAWYQNVYAPWEVKLQALKDRKAKRDARANKIAKGALKIVGSVIGGIYGGPMGAQAGGQAGESIGGMFGTPSNEQDMYSSTTRYS